MAREQKKEKKGGGMKKRIAVGCVAGFLLFSALICASASVFLKLGSDAAYYRAAGLCCAALAGMCGGFAAVIPVKKSGLITGTVCALITGAAVTAVLLAAADNFSLPGALLTAAAFLPGGAVGGVAAANVKKRPKLK